jgi:hypothetical protein
VALDTVDGLKTRVRGATAVEVTLENDAGGPKTRRVVGDDVEAAVRAELARAEAEGRRVLAVNTVRPTLEDVFVRLTECEPLTGVSGEVDRAREGKRDAT